MEGLQFEGPVGPSPAPIYSRSINPMSKESLSSIPVELIRRHQVFPHLENHETIFLYSSRELGSKEKSEIEFISGKKISVSIKDQAEIRHLIEENYGLTGSIREISRTLAVPASSGPTPIVTRQEDQEKPVTSTQVQILDFIVDEAIRKRATDIHLERHEGEVRFRLRIDGVLIPQEHVPGQFYDNIISRIKILSSLDIGERRLPQDGKFIYKTYDIRVSILPGYYSEGATLRLLNRETKKLELQALGFYPETIEKIQRALGRPNGLILIAGPTGSGKNTTLYAMLQMLDSVSKKVVTIEDPVEYISNQFFQVQVKPQIGLDFAAGLRSILRSDPDVLLIGEVRDRETAEIASQFSNTGHLVFSTIHSNDNLGAIRRLTNDLGVSRASVAESLRLVISQRLVRKVCTHCSEKINGEMIGKGCRECHNTGYFGRTAVFEALDIDKALQEKVRTDKVTEDDILAALELQKAHTMKETIQRKIADGSTNSKETAGI